MIVCSRTRRESRTLVRHHSFASESCPCARSTPLGGSYKLGSSVHGLICKVKNRKLNLRPQKQVMSVHPKNTHMIWICSLADSENKEEHGDVECGRGSDG